MSIHMTHPETGGAYLAQPSQVEFLKASGWELSDPQATYDQWPDEVKLFDGQPQVRLRHPQVDGEITVAESSAPFHQSQGWQRVEDVQLAELEDQTVEQLKDQARERDLPVSGTKAELIERLADAPADTDDDQPAEPADKQEDEA